jgi:hypothetical protein
MVWCNDEPAAAAAASAVACAAAAAAAAVDGAPAPTAGVAAGWQVMLAKELAGTDGA